MAVHPRLALALAPKEAFRAAYARYIASLPETPSAYMLHALTTERVPLLEPGGLHLAAALCPPAGDYWLGPMEERPMFVAQAGEPGHNASSNDPAVAQVGAQVFGAILPAAHEETEAWAHSAPGSRPREYLEHKERVAGILARRLDAQCPELRGRWRMLEMATPLTFRHHGGSPFGSLYGVQQRLDSLRIMPQTRLENLYLTGQNITGPGVLGAVISAYATCGRIVGRERLLAEVRRCA
jgi:all-trans-retinol 13,14-reductase